ncbi:MAG: universal stress protein [Candidatus Tectimicrobiota bacterium]
MLGFHRILLATDFSPGATAALHYAAALAHLSPATLQVLHVIDTRVATFSRWTDVFRSTEVLATRTASDTTMFQTLLKEPDLTGLSVTPLLQHGHPAEHIIDAAADVDLVVLGTQGGAASSTLGTVARAVVHASPAAVLLVPPACPVPVPPPGELPLLPVQHLVLALHVVRYAPQALALSQALARLCQASLSVLQVLDPATFRSYRLDAGGGLSYNLEGTYALLQKRLEDVVPDTFAPTVERLVRIGDTVETILQHLRDRQADLVVLSVHTYGNLKKIFTTSTVDALLQQLPCPLLAVPLPPET